MVDGSALRAGVRQFVAAEIVPHLPRWEDAGEIPRSLFRELGKRGWLGVGFPTEWGGVGGTWLDTLVVAEELARCEAGGVALAVGVQVAMVGPTLLAFGTPAQKHRYLRGVLRGELIGALAITEPEAGSDVAAIRTTARRVEAGWVLNGTKMFITNGCRADFVIVVARTGQVSGYQGLSLFIVDRETPGFAVGKKLAKVGMRSSDTAELVFTDCLVPAESLLGQEGQGFYHIMWELQGERLFGGAMAAASALWMLEQLWEHARACSRANVEPWLGRLAESFAAALACRELVYDTTRRILRQEYPVTEVSAIKLLAGRVQWQAAELALEFMSAHGCPAAWAERMWRDSRLTRIGGGTDEIMRNIIFRQLREAVRAHGAAAGVSP